MLNLSRSLGPGAGPCARIIQMSDCHLGATVGETLLGLDTDQSLDDVLKLLAQDKRRADCVVATGDIACGGCKSAYERFIAAVQQQYPSPLAWLPGNHDSDLVMRQFPHSIVQRDWVELEHWQIILLNSSVSGKGYGDIAEQELLRLTQRLQDCSKHTLVMMHHQPAPVGSRWVDAYVTRNGQALLELLAAAPQVKALCWGHIHQEYSGQYEQLSLLGCPSTCVQFKPNCDEFTVDRLMPGYRWFDLFANGEFNTGVSRVSEKAYAIDYASGGY